MAKRNLALMALVMFAMALASASASAANYYGIATLQGTSFHGTDVTIRSNDLFVSNVWQDFADNDNWDVSDPSANYWVEAGMLYGTACCNITATSPSFFWADSRPNGGGFHSHLGVPVSLNTYYDDKIRYAGSGTWNINVGGWTGTSTSNIDGAGVIDTGTEVTTQSATVCSSQSNLQWWDQNGGLHSGWSDSTGNAGRVGDNPPYVVWVSPQSWLRDYANISC